MGIKTNAIREHNRIHNAREERAIKITQYLDEAADLMELEEAGLLIHLPCKVGDTLFSIQDNQPVKYNVKRIIVLENGLLIHLENIHKQSYYIIPKQIGIDYYKTMEEALHVLSEMRKHHE